MLFIDSNQYLDLYEKPGLKALLNTLTGVSKQVFVTSQIVDEVTRKKVAVAEKFLSTLKMGKIDRGVPDQLFNDIVTRDLKSKLRDISEKIRLTNQDIEKAVRDLLLQISQSNDDVSKALHPIFSRATDANQSEFDRARARKERGSAPGKSGNALGDQISWEQFLTSAKEGQWPQVWIIARDKDFFSKETVVLNGALYRDLVQVHPDIKVHCFTQLEKGLRDFIEVNSVPGVQLPTLEEADAINKEQEASPPFDLRNFDDGGWYAVVQQMAAHRRNLTAGYMDPNSLNQPQPVIFRSASNVADGSKIADDKS